MSEEVPRELNPAFEDLLKPEVTEFTTHDNIKVQFINIGGKITKLGYQIENEKRLRQGLPPALMKIVHQERVVENGTTIHKVEVL
jgi:hypothetical protein